MAGPLAETHAADDELSPEFRAFWGDYSPVMLHRIRILDVLKGADRPSIGFFQEVSSGRFDVELGGEYLLFFHRHRPYSGGGSVLRDAVYVRHACGPSKPWREVTALEVVTLCVLTAFM